MGGLVVRDGETTSRSHRALGINDARYLQVKAGHAADLQAPVSQPERAAIVIELAHRALEYLGAIGDHLAGHREAVLPATGDGGIAVLGTVGHAHPSNEDAPAVLGHESLGRVEIEPTVPEMKPTQLIGAYQRPCKGHVATGIHIGACLRALQPLGAYRQQVERLFLGTAVLGTGSRGGSQAEKIRAFPHVTHGLWGDDLVFQAPAGEVLRAKDQKLASVMGTI